VRYESPETRSICYLRFSKISKNKNQEARTRDLASAEGDNGIVTALADALSAPVDERAGTRG
jgi:hypothetical protein